MTIDKEKLVELLVEKTGFEKEKVEGQLSELVKRIMEVTGEGKRFEIEGFGTFSLHEDKLQFDPSVELKTEINNQYAGMEPIELVGAYQEDDESKAEPVTASAETDEPDEDTAEEQEVEEAPVTTEDEDIEAEPEENEDEIWGVKDYEPSSFTFDVDNETLDQAEDISEEEQAAPWEEESESGEEPHGSSEDEESGEIPFPVMETGEESEEPILSDESAEETAGEKREAKWEPAPELQDTYAPSARKEEGDKIGNILIILVIIIAAGVGIWFAYDLGLFSGLTGTPDQQMNNADNQQNQQQVEQQQNDLPAAQQEQPDAQSGDPGSTGESDTPQEEQSSEPAEQNEVAKGETGQTIYGLKGDPVPEANNGYTIVVHSIRSVTKARDIRDQLDADGYRTVLKGAIVNGQQYWRIGLGQFETVGDAQEAANELGEPFSTNFFIKRIES